MTVTSGTELLNAPTGRAAVIAVAPGRWTKAGRNPRLYLGGAMLAVICLSAVAAPLITA